MTIPQWECLADLHTQLSVSAGCIKRVTNSAGTKHSLPKHAGLRSSLVPPGLRDLGKAGTGSWFCSNLGHKETPSPCLPPGPQAQGNFGAASPDGYTAGSQGNAESREEKLHKPWNAHFCFGNGEGDTALCWHSPQAGRGTDWFLFNYFYSSLGGCCTIYCGLGKTHAPSLEGKMARAAF